MNRYTFLTTFTEAMAQDEDLRTWAMAHFGQSHKVYSGLDNTDIPGAGIEKEAYIILDNPGKNSSSLRRDVEYSFALILSINLDEYQVETIPAAANYKEPSGVKLILEMIRLTIEVVIANTPAEFDVEIDEETETVGMLPQVQAFLLFKFTHSLNIGDGNPLTI